MHELAMPLDDEDNILLLCPLQPLLMEVRLWMLHAQQHATYCGADGCCCYPEACSG